MMLSVKPVVTLGLCVKNEEANVKGAVDTVLSQDFPHELMELIIVDGHSRDGTVNVIKRALSKGDIKNRICFERSGLGHARQMVVERARGKYIVWVDGDMRLSKDYVKKQVEFMEKNPVAGIASGRYGVCPGSMVATLENLAYVVDSFKWSGGRHPKLPGTEGSIFRVKAVKKVGGFDKRMRGACEDIEVAFKMKAAGWSLYMTTALFYEKCRGTWQDLWVQYAWWGYGGHYLFHKDRRINPVYEMVPPAGFVAGLIRSFIAYRITLRKISFLLPIHYTFKRMAWCLGFIKGHLEGYGHNGLQAVSGHRKPGR